MINSLKTLVHFANAPFISGGGNSHVSNHLQHRPRMATVALLLLTFSFFNITSAWADVCDSWLTDGTGLNRYAGIYRVLCPMNLPTGGFVENIQEPVSGTPAIYFGDMGTVTDCSLGTGNYTVRGTGLYLHLSALTNHYTEVTITSGGVNYTFTVEYKNGGKLYFVKPQGWIWSYVYAYMWNGDNNNKYPGTEMTTNESVALEHCTADIYEVAYNSAYNKLKFNDKGSNDIDNLDISGENMYYVPSIMSNPTSVTNWKWCASQGVNLRIGDAAGNYYADDSSHKFAFAQGSGHTLTTTVTLAGNTVYYFKLEQTQEDKWYTHHGASNTAGEGQMTSSNCTDWDMAYNRDDPATKILTTEPGEYTFTYNYTSDRLSVTYPISEPTTVPADPENLNDCQIKSIFGASLFPNAGVTNIERDEPLNVANQTHRIAGKDVLQITFTEAHKTMLKFSELDLTGYTHVHFDVWSPVAREFATSILCNDGGYKGENVSHVENLTAQTWKSVDFALSSLDGMSDYYDHAQALIVNMGVGTTALTSTFYITNIYFYKTTSDETCYADCGVDVARGKQTWAGVYETPATSPDKAVDGTGAEWCTGGNQSYDNQWWVVDLGHYYELDQIQIQFENARTKHMLLQTRKDKPTSEQMASTAAWTTIQDVRGANDDGTGTILGNYNTNTYNVSGKKARYVRFKTEENTHSNAYGCKIRLFKVCVSGFATDDSNPPTMVSATYVSNNDRNTGVIVELKANDSEGDVSRFRLDEEGGGSTFVNTDGSHRATLDGIASGSHTYHVYAIDGAGNVSANYEELSFCFLNPAENLALNKTCYAGHETGNADETKEKANDGNLANYWTSWNGKINTDDWWYVDLGDIYRLSTIDLYWYLDGGQRLGSEDYIIQVRQTAPVDAQVTNEDEWTTVAHETKPKCGQTENTDKNSYSVDIDARFVRVQSKQRNSANQQIRLNEMLVYGSACGSLDGNAPVVNASLHSVGVGQTVLSVSATDKEDGAIYDFYVTNNVTDETSVLTDDNHDGKITITGLESCVTYSFTIKAKDKAVNWSNNAVVGSVTPAINNTINLALHATTSAGHTENDASATTANAIDGDNDTQWNGTGATAGTNEWFRVDLGRTYDLREVKILWSKTGGEDNGGTYPVNYKLQGSNNGTDFYTFAHYSSKTETGQWLDYTTTDPLPARYVRVWVDQHSTYAMGIRELEVYSKDECFVEQEPVITFAEITNLTPSGVTVSCDAYANTTNMAGMRFYYELTNTGTGLTTPGTLAHTDGSITVTGLEPNINYSLKIYAEITSSSARSANYKELTFNLTYSSLHYLTEETECNWQAGLYNTEWQFAFTDRYSPTEVDKGGAPLRILEYTHHTISNHVDTDPPTIQYKLYEAGYGGIWTSGGNLFFRNPKDKPLKMYALGTEKFVCNLDELYVSGEAVGGWWTESNKPSSATAAKYQMRYDDETGLFSWTGDVVPGTGKNFKIVIRDIRGVDATADVWAYNRIMQANATYDREWTRATLYFDMSTWTWWWESAMAGCVREGGPGVHNTDNGGQEFTDGYKLNSYVVTEDGKRYFVVEAEPLDAELNNAILHIYKDESAAVTEVGKDGDAKTYKVGSTTHTYYRFKKLVSDIPGAINGIIRYYVKFEGPDGIIRNTKYHYYDLPHNECAPDTWIIYHHGQAPEVGDRETFDGGRIVQPIEYRRKFDLDTWYSLYLPFDVTAVKVISGGTYYDLLPYYRTDGGTLKGKQYIIRKAKPVENMPIVNVENRLPSESPNGWFDPSESEYETFLPQRNTPYIIQFHNKYYEDKWIAFFGKWYSTIETKFSENAAPTNDEVVNIYGNNTMKDQSLSGQCYQLNYDEYDSYAWTRFDNVTLYPFECYILANETTTAKYRVLRRGAAEDTPTGMEDVYEESGDIRVYTIAGKYLCTLHNMSPDEAGQHLQSRLTEGVYILRTPALSYKLIIGGL